MQVELPVAGQSLWCGCREVEELKESLAMAKVALGAVDEEAAQARAAKAPTHAELAGELKLCFAFFVRLSLPWI